MKNKIPIICVLILIIVAVIFTGGDAFARVGGGENYNSGGGGYSSGGDHGGGGSGDGGGFPLYIIIRLIVLLFQINPVLGIVVLGGAIYFLIKFKSSAILSNSFMKYSVSNDGSSSFSKNDIAEILRDKKINLEQIMKRDPDFSEEKFLTGVESGFMKLQEAWSYQRLEPIRALVSSSVFTRFSVQVAEQKKDGWRNNMENIEIIGKQAIGAMCDRWFDTIHVRFTASASDYKTNITTGKILAGSKTPSQFVEIWSFLRRPGAKTKAGGGLWEGNCPSCGAALKISESSKCEYCGAIVNSGDYDWVLSEITQECEWTYRKKKEIQNINLISNIDPFFTPQAVEDLASTIFWKDASGRSQNSGSPLKRYVHPDSIQKIMDGWRQNGCTIYYQDAAVGSSELEMLEADGEWITAYVRIMYSAMLCMISPDGVKKQICGRGSMPGAVVYVMQKKKSAKSKVENGLASLNCPNCGAPESGSEKDTCDYCGAVLNSGDFRWVLTEIMAAHDYMMLIHQNKLKDQSKSAIYGENSDIADDLINMQGGQSLLAGLVFVAGADGFVDSAEREFIYEWADKLNVTHEKVDYWITAATSFKDTPKIKVPENIDEAAIWARALIRIALADREITNKERFALRQFCGRLGIQLIDLDRLINNEIQHFNSQNVIIKSS